jgi:hypothetical protein
MKHEKCSPIVAGNVTFCPFVRVEHSNETARDNAVQMNRRYENSGREVGSMAGE